MDSTLTPLFSEPSLLHKGARRILQNKGIRPCRSIAQRTPVTPFPSEVGNPQAPHGASHPGLCAARCSSDLLYSSLPVLVLLGCDNHNIRDWLAYKQRNSFLTVLEAAKSKIMVLADSVSGGGLLPGSETLFHVPSHGRRDKGAFFDHTMQHVRSYFPNQGLNLCPPAVEAWSPNHWTTREFPRELFFKKKI